MKINLLVLVFNFFSVPGLTYEQKVKKDLSGFQTMDMNQFKGIENKPTKSGVDFSVSCRTEDKIEIKSNDPAYQSCMERNAAKKKY